jgi:hypothetical protein
MDKATAEAKARELLSTKVTPLIGEWECSLRPDQISRFVPLIAAALEEAGADTRRLDCIISLVRESDDGTLPFFPVGRSTIDSYVAYRKIIAATPTPAESREEPCQCAAGVCFDVGPGCIRRQADTSADSREEVRPLE